LRHCQAHASSRPGGTIGSVHELRAYFRANPQVLLLVIICLVLGLGTFLVVVFGLLSAGSSKTTGEPSGVIALATVLAGR
jgi:hypothetical protein